MVVSNLYDGPIVSERGAGMDKQGEINDAQPDATADADAARRDFIIELAKAAIVPAVVAGIAASASTASAYPAG